LLPAPHTTLSEAEGELCGVPTELRGLGLRRGRELPGHTIISLLKL